MELSRSLTEGSINRGLLQFAFPILCTNAVQSLNGLVNSIWVGHYLGEAALAAVVNANSLIALLTAVVMGITLATSILVGQCVGAGDTTEIKRVVGTSLSLLAVISIVMALAGLILAETLLVSMKTPTDSLPLAVPYVRLMFLAMPSMHLYMFVLFLLRGAGNSRTPLYFILLSVLIGIVLNPVLIFGFWPLPGFGVTGSAIATFFAQAVSLAALIVHLDRRRHPLWLRASELAVLRVSPSIAVTLVRKGTLMGTEMLVGSLTSILMLALINRLGVDTSAAFGAFTQLWTYILMPPVAIGMAVSAMAAQNVGAQRWDRVRSIVRVGVIYNIVLTSSIIAVVYALDTRIYGLFLPPGSSALSVANHINTVVTWSSVLLSISMVLFGIMRGTGAVMAPLLVNTLCLIIRLLLTAGLIEGGQSDAIWWSFPISSALAVVLAALCYKFGNWRAARPVTVPIPIQGVRIHLTASQGQGDRRNRLEAGDPGWRSDQAADTSAHALRNDTSPR